MCARQQPRILGTLALIDLVSAFAILEIMAGSVAGTEATSWQALAVHLEIHRTRQNSCRFAFWLHVRAKGEEGRRHVRPGVQQGHRGCPAAG